MDNPAISTPAGEKPRDITQNHDSGEAKAVSQQQSSNGSTESKPATTPPKAPSKNNQGWRHVVRNFSPSWFATTMGTGVVAVIFSTIPFEARWLYWMSIIFFALNTSLFSLALGISILRYTIWPEIWTVMIEDPNNSLFLGTVPMGFATLIEMWVHVCVPAWGEWAAYLVLALWIVDCVVAVAVTVSLGILLMSESYQRSLDSITAAQLLPIAATIVAAGAGSEVASVMPDPQLALGVIIASYVLWGMATPMAFTVLVIYYQRLALHKMPPREVIVSAFLPLGPLGFGGFTILNLGKRAAVVFPQTGTLDPLAGRIAYVLGCFVALIMWGWGLLWFSFALAALWKTAKNGGIPMNMGWWGFTFPLGVYASSTMLLGRELPSLFFRVLGTIFGAAVILLWGVIAVRTARGAYSGELFRAPCLANLKAEPQEAPQDGGESETASGGLDMLSK
jgi:C4-dicarboxylate transporter/malic acid transport protein